MGNNNHLFSIDGRAACPRALATSWPSVNGATNPPQDLSWPASSPHPNCLRASPLLHNADVFSFEKREFARASCIVIEFNRLSAARLLARSSGLIYGVAPLLCGLLMAGLPSHVWHSCRRVSERAPPEPRRRSSSSLCLCRTNWTTTEWTKPKKAASEPAASGRTSTSWPARSPVWPARARDNLFQIIQIPQASRLPVACGHAKLGQA